MSLLFGLILSILSLNGAKVPNKENVTLQEFHDQAFVMKVILIGQSIKWAKKKHWTASSLMWM